MKKFGKISLYYFLSFTWGLPLTAIGCIVAIFLLLAGKRPQFFGPSLHFTIGRNWGGVDLGPVFITSNTYTTKTVCHEFGHSLQNCVFGPLTLFVVCIPSVFRYWYREFRYERHGQIPPTRYDDAWFEGQATMWGRFVYTHFFREITR